MLLLPSDHFLPAFIVVRWVIKFNTVFFSSSCTKSRKGISQRARENLLFFSNCHRKNHSAAAVEKHNIGCRMYVRVWVCGGENARQIVLQTGDVSYSLGIINNSDLKKPKTPFGTTRQLKERSLVMERKETKRIKTNFQVLTERVYCCFTCYHQAAAADTAASVLLYSFL